MKYVLILLLLAACMPVPQERTEINESRVGLVVDGDTFILSNGEYVRIIGVDAPEKGEEGYEEAADFLRERVEGKTVQLFAEGEDRDQYGRLLRHVYLNETNIAVELLEERHAFLYMSYKGNLSGIYSEAAK